MQRSSCVHRRDLRATESVQWTRATKWRLTLIDVGTHQEEQVEAPVPKSLPSELNDLSSGPHHVLRAPLPVVVRVESTLARQHLRTRVGEDGAGWRALSTTPMLIRREIELVESTGRLHELAELADEVVGNGRCSDVRDDVLLEGD